VWKKERRGDWPSAGAPARLYPAERSGPEMPRLRRVEPIRAFSVLGRSQPLSGLASELSGSPGSTF
jgi:hypothetical protein